MNNPVITVISLGGSILVPDLPNGQFARTFVEAIKERVASGRKFIIVVGGGKTARNYQQAFKDTGSTDSDSADWIGIYATRLNAELLRLAFGTLAHGEIISDPTKKIEWNESVLLAGGWIPGRSTDYDAVKLAETYGATRVVNISNVDYVYTADPKKDANAQKIEKIGWADFRKLLPEKWDPGLSVPFDPTAAVEAEKLSIVVNFVNGSDLKNVFTAIDEHPFKGTTISV